MCLHTKKNTLLKNLQTFYKTQHMSEKSSKVARVSRSQILKIHMLSDDLLDMQVPFDFLRV